MVGTIAGWAAALAGVPLSSRHLQGTFGPAAVRLAGLRAVLELDDGGRPPLRLSWTDTPDRAVSRQIAALLRAVATVVFDAPDLLRIAGTHSPADPSVSDAPRQVRAMGVVGDGLRVEVTYPGSQCGRVRAVVIPVAEAHNLADLLDTWADLPSS